MLKQLKYEQEELKRRVHAHGKELLRWKPGGVSIVPTFLRISFYQKAFDDALLLQRVIDLEEKLEEERQVVSSLTRKCLVITTRGGLINTSYVVDLLESHEERYTQIKKERDQAYENYRRRNEQA